MLGAAVEAGTSADVEAGPVLAPAAASGAQVGDKATGQQLWQRARMHNTFKVASYRDRGMSTNFQPTRGMTVDSFDNQLSRIIDGWASARALQAGLTKLEMPSKEDMKALFEQFDYNGTRSAACPRAPRPARGWACFRRTRI